MRSRLFIKKYDFDLLLNHNMYKVHTREYGMTGEEKDKFVLDFDKGVNNYIYEKKSSFRNQEFKALLGETVFVNIIINNNLNEVSNYNIDVNRNLKISKQCVMPEYYTSFANSLNYFEMVGDALLELKKQNNSFVLRAKPNETSVLLLEFVCDDINQKNIEIIVSNGNQTKKLLVPITVFDTTLHKGDFESLAHVNADISINISRMKTLTDMNLTRLQVNSVPLIFFNADGSVHKTNGKYYDTTTKLKYNTNRSLVTENINRTAKFYGDCLNWVRSGRKIHVFLEPRINYCMPIHEPDANGVYFFIQYGTPEWDVALIELLKGIDEYLLDRFHDYKKEQLVLYFEDEVADAHPDYNPPIEATDDRLEHVIYLIKTHKPETKLFTTIGFHATLDSWNKIKGSHILCPYFNMKDGKYQGNELETLFKNVLRLPSTTEKHTYLITEGRRTRLNLIFLAPVIAAAKGFSAMSFYTLFQAFGSPWTIKDDNSVVHKSGLDFGMFYYLNNNPVCNKFITDGNLAEVEANKLIKSMRLVAMHEGLQTANKFSFISKNLNELNNDDVELFNDLRAELSTIHTHLQYDLKPFGFNLMRDFRYDFIKNELTNLYSKITSAKSSTYRFIRVYSRGSDKSHFNLINELEVYSNGVNVAYNANLNTNSTFQGLNLNNATDLRRSSYANLGNDTTKDVYLELDFTYPIKIDKIAVNRNTMLGYKMKNNKLLISKDGEYWQTIFDSEVDGRYIETELGREFIIN